MTSKVEEEEEENIRRLRESLTHFFLRDVKKWYELIFDLIKLFVLSVVLYHFGVERYRVTSYYTFNENALQNIFFPTGQVLKEFDLRPREVGILAVTDIRQITKIIDYIIITLDELDEYSLYYSKGSNASICLSRENTTCHVLDNTKGFASQKWLQIHFSFIPMKNANLEYISLNFYVKARVGGAQRPIFKVIVLFDNSHHDGMMPLNLKIDYEPSIFSLPPLKNERDQHWICLFSVIMSLVSLLRGVWKVYNGIFLGIMTKKIFERKFKWKMEFYEKCAFLHLSNIFLIFGCILNILGCYYIIDLRLSRVIDPKKWDFGAVMMSLTYFSSIFHLTTYMERNKPNILLMTIKYSLPKFIRFLAPASCVYFAFVLTAWIVIGPYHPKFREIEKTSESLFSLINGDDMFPTFTSLSRLASPLIIVFSKLFLYFFIILFIYLLLSITISISSTTFEHISKKYEEDPDWRIKEMRNQRLHAFYMDNCQDEVKKY